MVLRVVMYKIALGFCNEVVGRAVVTRFYRISSLLILQCRVNSVSAYTEAQAENAMETGGIL